MGCTTSRARHDDGGFEEFPEPPANEVPTVRTVTASAGHGERNRDRHRVTAVAPESLAFGRASTAHHGERSQTPVIQAAKLRTTRTVRSVVNIKKQSLSISPEDGDSGKYRISFVVDCSTPCLASIYIMAYQKREPKTGGPPRIKSKHSKSEPSLVVPFEGLQQPYSTPEGEGLPLGSFGEEELLLQAGSPHSVYPIVIRIQPTNTSEDIGEGKQAVQAQTTFATLLKLADGRYTIQVLKQVLWVEGTSYVLHEIYGIEGNEDSQLEGRPESHVSLEGKECVVCLVDTRDTLVMPCRHLCLCTDCAREIARQSLINKPTKCPICRSDVSSLLTIKVNDKEGKKPSGEEEITVLQAGVGDGSPTQTDEVAQEQVGTGSSGA